MTLVVSNTTNLEMAIQHDSVFYEESTRVTVASETDPIGSWSDQSGNSAHAEQVTTSYKPVLDDGFVTFRTADQQYLLTTVSDSIFEGDFSWYAVLTPYNGDPNFFAISTGSDFILFENSSGSYRLRAQIGTSGNRNTSVASSTFDETPQVLSLISDGTDIIAYIDGVEVCSIAKPTGSFDFSSAPWGWGIAFQNSANTTGEMDLYGCWLYSEAHDSTERGDIEDELTAAYLDNSQTINADAIAITVSAEEASVIGPLQTVNADAIAITVSAEEATISVSTQTINADAIAITVTAEEPTVSAGAVTVSPTAIAVTATVEEPSVIGPAQTVSPSVIEITATVEEPTVTNVVQGEVYGGSIAITYPYAGAMGITYPYSGTIEVA